MRPTLWTSPDLAPGATYCPVWLSSKQATWLPRAGSGHVQLGDLGPYTAVLRTIVPIVYSLLFSTHHHHHRIFKMNSPGHLSPLDFLSLGNISPGSTLSWCEQPMYNALFDANSTSASTQVLNALVDYIVSLILHKYECLREPTSQRYVHKQRLSRIEASMLNAVQDIERPHICYRQSQRLSSTHIKRQQRSSTPSSSSSNSRAPIAKPPHLPPRGCGLPTARVAPPSTSL